MTLEKLGKVGKTDKVIGTYVFITNKGTKCGQSSVGNYNAKVRPKKAAIQTQCTNASYLQSLHVITYGLRYIRSKGTNIINIRNMCCFNHQQEVILKRPEKYV